MMRLWMLSRVSLRAVRHNGIIRPLNMVPVAQSAERHTVDVDVEGSNPFRHPLKKRFRREGVLFINDMITFHFLMKGYYV